MTVPFRFDTPDDGHPTDAMMESFAVNGFCLLEGFADAADCDALTVRAQEIVEAFDPAKAGVFSAAKGDGGRDEYFETSGDKIRCFLEEEALDARGDLMTAKAGAVNKIGHALHDLDDVFAAFSHGDRLAMLAVGLGLADARLLQSMFIFKSPRIGGEVSWHQDATYLHTVPESVTGFWFALDDASEENGCLQVIPGGHKGPLRSLFWRDGSELKLTVQDDTPLDASEVIHLPANKGDLVVFHGRLPHASAPNRSDRSRHAYTLHAIDGNAEYTAGNWLQRSADMPLKGFDL